ncbi:MAG: cell division protein ZapA [Nitrospirota bacterium]|nr:cell division protein ZapA [Nitrospirota bacterium]
MDKVQVEIFGQTYLLKGSPDSSYVRDLAQFIDAKMKDIQKGTGTSDGYRLAILTALNIADELYRTRTDHASTQASVGDAIERILELTDGRSSEHNGIS